MSLVRVERGARVAVVTLARPDVRNAVSTPLLEELVGALGDLATEPEVRAVVLAGDGPDFCAGADFAELAGARSGPSGMDYGRSFEEAMEAIEASPAPVIASVQGAALGAGCQLVLACDLAVAAMDARLGVPSARLGILINFESIQRLVLAVGPKRAGEVLFTGRAVSGTEAAAWGLVNEAVPAGDLQEATAALAEGVAEAAPLSVLGSKRGVQVIRQNLSVDRFAEGHLVADFDMMAAAAFASEDLEEGIEAFRERRRPRFRGR
jgi:enoyl-CoA hydratase/carnithine racemase